MKILLTACNAKFIHSSLALRCLKKFAVDLEENIFIAEYTINQDPDFILREIYEQEPDVVCFSCYIWNIGFILTIAENLKKILPQVVIVLGGPEVSYDAIEILKQKPFIDIIIRGEGERAFLSLAKYFVERRGTLEQIRGISYRIGKEMKENLPAEPIQMDELPFVYDDMTELEHKIIYYETQRGCPYRCQYCLSSIEKGVRFLSQKRIATDLQFFLKNYVKQVKFVDRTFNCNKEHALFIWKYLMAHDNGVTNFHMEITADLLDEETLDLLSQARPGLFQFEIGVQSTNEKTIAAIQRNTYFDKLCKVVKRIKKGGNIHQHLDLIAGLPFENYESFSKSFNDVYALEPEQFQLGFLKLLKGSGLYRDAEKYGIVFHSQAPYEVFMTRELSYKELLRLKMNEEMIEVYYNSGKALFTIRFLLGFFSSAFAFYEALGDYWERKGHHRIQHSKMELFTILYQFALENPEVKKREKQLKTVLKFDIYIGDNVKTLPVWLEEQEGEKEKEWKRAFFENREQVEKFLPELVEYQPRQLARMCHIAFFSYNPMKLADMAGQEAREEETAILFHYNAKNIFPERTVFYQIK